MSRVGLLCPGQGAQQVGMGLALRRDFPEARRVFEEADTALGLGLAAICAEGPEALLTDTRVAQPALLTHSVAVVRVLETEQGLEASVAAGHSLGEWSALVVSGALDLATAVVAVRRRGEFMAETAGAGKGGMTALLGGEVELVQELCLEASLGDEVVVPANFNGGGQIVVAGHIDALLRLESLASARRIRCTRLRVSAAFHSPLMAVAAQRMEAVVGALMLRDPRFPVLSNVDAKPHTKGEDFRELLVQQITQPVRWQECGERIAGLCDVALEIGPGRILAGLMKRIARGLVCRPLGEPGEVRDWLLESGGISV